MTSTTGKHLKYFKAKNFKNFSDLELEDISLFYVLVGDNNVGKTNLLEALSCKYYSINSCLRNLHYFLFQRIGKPGIGDVNSSYLNNYFNINQSAKKFEFEYKYANGDENFSLELKNKVDFSQEEINSFVNLSHTDLSKISSLIIVDNGRDRTVLNPDFTQHLDYKPEDNYMPLIFSNQSAGIDLTGFYSDMIFKSKTLKKEAIDNLSLFFNEIDDIEISQSDLNTDFEIFIGFKNRDKLMPLSMFGDGAIKYFRILLEILISKEKILNIDEIDNGIHYSKQTEFIGKVIESAIQNKTQIFCTTHSYECLLSIKKAFNSEKLNKSKNLFRGYSLNKTKNGEVKAYKYDFEQFSATLDSDADIRGF